jgi:hypothetical protein
MALNGAASARHRNICQGRCHAAENPSHCLLARQRTEKLLLFFWTGLLLFVQCNAAAPAVMQAGAVCCWKLLLLAGARRRNPAKPAQHVHMMYLMCPDDDQVPNDCSEPSGTEVSSPRRLQPTNLHVPLVLQ